MLHILAERRGFEPLRRCRRSRISNPAPYLLGQRSMWRRLEDLNPHTLAGCGFLDRCNSRSASSRRMLVGRAGFEPAACPMSLIYSQFPSPVWIPTHVVGGAGSDPALQYASRIARFLRLTRSRRLWLAPAQPSGCAALLSVVSQLLSVCIPPGFHGRELPCWWGIQDLHLGHYSSSQLS